MGNRELYCDGCQTTMLFEVPPCEDGHGQECPELVCTGCGAALLIATALLTPVVSSPAPRKR